MNMDTILDSISKIDLKEAVNSMNLQDLVSAPEMRGVLIASIVIALLLCFFGLKLVRILAALLGAFTGAAIGAGAAFVLGFEQTYILIASLVVGIILAVICAALYHVGVFLIVWAAGISVSSTFLSPLGLTGVLISAGIGLVCALFTLKFAEPVTMVLTGMEGAVRAGTGIVFFLPVQELWVRIAVTAGLAVLGIMVQFLMESGKRKRQNLKKAKEIRERNSTENEVERARAMIENLDTFPEEEDEE